MKKLICAGYALTGLIGLILAMNEDANHINFIGLGIFVFSVYFGKKYCCAKWNS